MEPRFPAFRATDAGDEDEDVPSPNPLDNPHFSLALLGRNRQWTAPPKPRRKHRYPTGVVRQRAQLVVSNPATGEAKTLQEWANELGISLSAFRKRMKKAGKSRDSDLFRHRYGH